MRRKLVVVLMVVAAFWQVLAVGGRPSVFAGSREAMHTMLHWQGQAHHHHKDGSITQDVSRESVQHVVFDGVFASPAVASEPSLALPAVEVARPPVADELSGPSPYLAGLKRPPRLLA